MKHITAGLFTDRERASEAAEELGDRGFSDSISIITRDMDSGEVETEVVDQDVRDGAAVGATAGGFIGAIAGLLTAAVPVTIAGLGIVLVGGPLAALLGAATGALAGGLVGALVDLGFPDDTAQIYEESIYAGEVLVTAETTPENSGLAEQILEGAGAHDVMTVATEPAKDSDDNAAMEDEDVEVI